MIEEIPVTFEFRGKEYKGTLSKIAGGGSDSMFHLNVGGYHWGQLFMSQADNKWKFYSNSYPEMTELFSDYFGDVIMLWYE
jgi:hypothetical protein